MWKSPLVRWDKGSGTASVWRSLRRGWQRVTTNRATNIIDHHTYAICGDGDLMEGVTQEAASLAGHLRLGKLIYLYDDNLISLAGGNNLTFTEDVAKRFDAYGWHTRLVKEGNDTEEVAKAIEEAKAGDQQAIADSGAHAHGYGSPKKQIRLKRTATRWAKMS